MEVLVMAEMEWMKYYNVCNGITRLIMVAYGTAVNHDAIHIIHIHITMLFKEEHN